MMPSVMHDLTCCATNTRNWNRWGWTADDIRNIDEEHARQANAGRLLESSQQGLERLDADEGASASSLLNQTLDELNELAGLDSQAGRNDPAAGRSGCLDQGRR